MARSAADAALLLTYMAGGRQLLTRPKRGGLPLDGLRVGLPTSSFGGVAVDPIIGARYEQFGKELAELGATLVSVQAPRSAADNLSSTDGLNFFLTIVGKEIDEYHRRWFPARVFDYTNDVSATLTLIRATQTIGITRERARTAVATLKQGWEKAFADKNLDLVLQPAAVIPAPEKTRAVVQTQSIGDAMVVWDYLGWPVVCVPAGTGANGMPVGVQLVGRPGTEKLLASTAITAQAYNPHHKQRPPRV
jgi:aspartyl-tRNA(Asn)/glutamyl-tRNA(Gln) amidotransferase subunit A